MTGSRSKSSDVSTLIRPATTLDISAITSIYAHHVNHGLATFEEVPPDEDEMATRFDEISGKNLPYFVAILGGEPVGFAYASSYRTRSAYRFTLEDSVYLKSEATGQGLGKLLLSRVIEEATGLGYRQMIAVIGDSAHRPSIGLHEALAFKHAGLLSAVGFKHGRWVDTVLMQRTLGGGDATLPKELR